MCLEACAAGHFEVDLILEQQHRAAQQSAGPADERAKADQLIEGLVIGTEVLDPLQYASTALGLAIFAIDPMTAGRFGRLLQLQSPTSQIGSLGIRKKIPGHDVPFASHLFEFLSARLHGRII